MIRSFLYNYLSQKTHTRCKKYNWQPISNSWIFVFTLKFRVYPIYKGKHKTQKFKKKIVIAGDSEFLKNNVI